MSEGRPGAARRNRPVKMQLGGKPSGLRNPSRAMRGLGALTLIIEALLLLLAIQPMRVTQPDGITAVQLGVILGAFVFAILLTGVLSKSWGWWAVGGLQIALIAAGYLHWTLGAIGIIFGLVWLYVLYVRRRVLL